MNQETIEEALRKAYRKYIEAVFASAGLEQCRQKGNIKVWSESLMHNYGLSRDEVDAIIADEALKGTRKAG